VPAGVYEQRENGTYMLRVRFPAGGHTTLHIPVPKPAYEQRRTPADVVAAINEEIAKATAWASGHRDETAALWAEASGVDIAAQKRAVDRAEFGFGPLTDAVIAQQQAVADRFQRLGLIPAPIVVRDIVWFWKQTA